MTRTERMAAIGARAGYSATTTARLLTLRVFRQEDDIETASAKVAEYRRAIELRQREAREQNRERVLRVFRQVKADRGCMSDAERRCKRLGLTIDKEARAMWGRI